MVKKLSNSLFQPTSNVERVGRKIFFSGDVDEDSIHQLIKLLAEIEAEDDEYFGQTKAENSIGKLANCLTDNITDETAINIIKNYNKNENTYDREFVELYINTFGGEAYSTLYALDYIRNMKMPLRTYCGKCISAGFFLFLAGDERKAYMNSTFLYHPLQCGTSGDIQTVEEQMEENRRIQAMLEDYVLLTSGMTEEQLQYIKEEKKDYYMPAEEALELNICDEII